MVRIRNVIAAALAVLCAAVVSTAQTEDKPKGFLRQDDTGFYILIQTFAPVPAGSKMFTALATGKGELLDLETDVQNCPSPSPGKMCKKNSADKTELVYRLQRAPGVDETFKVRYAVTDAAGSGKLREVTASSDFALASVMLTNLCDNGILYTIKAGPGDKAYTDSRIDEINAWLKRQAADPKGIATVEVQPHTSANKTIYAVKDFNVEPTAADTSPGNRQLDLAMAKGARRVNICLRFQERLPYDKFDTRVQFTGGPPFELLASKVDTLAGLSQLKAVEIKDDKAVVGEKTLGLRGFDNTLDIGIIFTSGVKEEKQEDGTKKRIRDNVGVFDVRVAPWLRNRRSEPRLGTWHYYVTPIFLDAKVSTEKIDKDTHSLNRINIGTEHNFRFVQKTDADRAAERGDELKPGEGNTSGRRNKYVLTLRGVNASDRDFKRAELTGEFEFRPVWRVFNSPRSGDKRLITRVLKPDEDPVEASSLDFFGYQFQPFVGVNAGRTYRNKRDLFEGEEESDFVRRLYFGTDIILDLGPLFKVTLTDTFYVRGETPADRARNYFNGEVEAALGRIRRNTAQSLFVSFERGDKPPFTAFGVNAVKIGYRIRSDFTRVGTIKVK